MITNHLRLGSTDAQVLIVLDSPDNRATSTGQPISNGAWVHLCQTLIKVGIDLDRVMVTTLYPFQVGIDLSNTNPFDIDPYVTELHDLIKSMDNLAVIVPLGNYSAFHTMGKGNIDRKAMMAWNGTFGEDDVDISSLRGGVWTYDSNINVIPSNHPTMIRFNQTWIRRFHMDWSKISTRLQVGYKEFMPPSQNLIATPTDAEIHNFINDCFANEDMPLSLDIETWGDRLSCVGFAINPYEAICIRTENNYWLRRNIDLIRCLCEGPNPKVLINGMYDWYWLERDQGIRINNYAFDPQLMHHAIHSTDKQGLEYLTSIYLRRPAWKSMSKGEYDAMTMREKADKLWKYNCIDCCNTLELLNPIMGELTAKGKLEFYFRHYQELIEPLHRMSLHGVRINTELQNDCFELLMAECKDLQTRIVDMCDGFVIFGSKMVTERREPSKDEWERLIIKEKHEGEMPPKSKAICREAVRELKEAGLSYAIGGANAGTIAFKVEKLGNGTSTKKMITYFHDMLKIPKKMKYNRKMRKKTISMGKGAQQDMILKYPKIVGPVMQLIMLYKVKIKECDYFKGAWDSDNRIRCSFKMLTEAGRLASSKNPMRTGYNLQNVKR